MIAGVTRGNKRLKIEVNYSLDVTWKLSTQCEMALHILGMLKNIPPGGETKANPQVIKTHPS